MFIFDQPIKLTTSRFSSYVQTKNEKRHCIVNNNLFHLLILTAFVVSAPIYQCSQVPRIHIHKKRFGRKIKANKSLQLIITAIAQSLVFFLALCKVEFCFSDLKAFFWEMKKINTARKGLKAFLLKISSMRNGRESLS